MLKNLRYYANRDKDTPGCIERIEVLAASLPEAGDVKTLMGIEGNIRQCYFDSFDAIIPG